MSHVTRNAGDSNRNVKFFQSRIGATAPSTDRCPARYGSICFCADPGHAFRWSPEALRIGEASS
jgi:hypothetical protein